MHSTGFNPDPVISKPLQRLRTSDAIGHPLSNETLLAIPPSVKSSQTSFYQSEGSGSYLTPSGMMSSSPSPTLPAHLDARQAGLQAPPELYQRAQASPTRSSQTYGMPEWGIQQAQLQQMIDQQALLTQLQSHMQQAQLSSTPPQQPGLPSLISQQMQASVGVPDSQRQPLEASRAPYSHPGGGLALPPPWPGPPANLPGVALPELQGLKHPMYMHDDKKHGRVIHGLKGRQAEMDVNQAATSDKLRREVSRLHAELERLEKEIGRQKSLRETERVEFTDAKDRLKQSWAADRDDFARVKSMLKAKNAEHHTQSSRLSQQLKEIEGVNRGLRDLCARHGVTVPVELEVTHSKHHALPHHSSSSAPSSYMSISSSSQMSTSTYPSSQLSMIATSREMPAAIAAALAAEDHETAYDSDHGERSGKTARRGYASQPPSPTSAANAIMSMVQQLPKLLNREQHGEEGSEHPASAASDNVAAAQAAARAAAALGHLATALKVGASSKPATPRSSSPVPASRSLPVPQDTRKHAEESSDLNRMSLQSWIAPQAPQQNTSLPSRNLPDVSEERALRSEAATAALCSMPQTQNLEFHSVDSQESTPFEREAQKPPPDSDRPGKSTDSTQSH